MWLLSPSPPTESKLPTSSMPRSRREAERGANPNPGADKSAESFIWRHGGKQCECPPSKMYFPAISAGFRGEPGSLHASFASLTQLCKAAVPADPTAWAGESAPPGDLWGGLGASALCVCGPAANCRPGAGCAGTVCDGPARLGRESQKAGSQAWEKEGKRGWVGEEEGERKGQRQWCDLAKQQKG